MAGALPGVAFAAAGEENEAELQVISDIQETESHEMSVHEMAVQTAEMDQLPEISGTEKIADVEAAGNTERADVIDTQEELEAAIAQGGEIDLTGQRIELTRRLSIANDVVIRGGILVGTDSVTGNLVTLMGNSITLDHVTIQTSAGNNQRSMFMEQNLQSTGCLLITAVRRAVRRSLSITARTLCLPGISV